MEIKKMKNFALTGAAGYIAPRHLQAIRDTGNRLVAALDPHDSVGILDRFFHDTVFFTDVERFDRFLDRLRRGPEEERIHYLSVCSPNYLHDAHIRLALRSDADAICEKPIVLNPWNLDALQDDERETGRSVKTILQLRVHPSLLELRSMLEKTPANRRHDVTLTYVTSRGPWYLYSWKGSVEQSGGLATNIGIHLFDLLLWLFGSVQQSEIHLANDQHVGGFFELQHANVRWFLSIKREDLPPAELEKGKSTYRSIAIDGKEIEFSEGFNDLHTRVYEEILAGRGFGIDDARPSVELAYRLRNADIVRPAGNIHENVARLLLPRL
jgi:UDP-N-acetyl-2-amino-2-deoxyglucuronate dehydrogenase